MANILKTVTSDVQVKQFADQSVFVKAAVSGVVREGVIAAALTALMILLFLGSWRSTTHHCGVHSAFGVVVSGNPEPARSDDQHHDAWRSGARSRYPGG